MRVFGSFWSFTAVEIINNIDVSNRKKKKGNNNLLEYYYCSGYSLLHFIPPRARFLITLFYFVYFYWQTFFNGEKTLMEYGVIELALDYFIPGENIAYIHVYIGNTAASLWRAGFHCTDEVNLMAHYNVFGTPFLVRQNIKP